MKYKYDCILYDFDGTLADTVPSILKSYKLAYEEVLGECSRTDEDLLSYIGLPLYRCFEMHDEETASKLFDTYLRINMGMLSRNEVSLFEGVREELDKIRRLGIKQGIVTSKRRESLMVSIEFMGLSSVFDIFVVKEDTVNNKPHPEPILYACEELDVSTERTLYVGDAIGDIKCAKNALCDSAFVLWSSMPHDEIMKLNPTYALKEISDLSCIIRGCDL